MLRTQALICLLVFWDISKASAADRFQIYYIPRYIQTYSSISGEDIEAKAHYQFSLNSSAIEDLISSSTKVEGTLLKASANHLRIKIRDTNDNTSIFIDQSGQIVAGKKRKKLSLKVVREALQVITQTAAKHKSKFPEPVDEKAELSFPIIGDD